MSEFQLADSVGSGGVNNPSDVRTLRRHLVDLGYDWLSVDTTVNEELTAVINLLQSIKNGRNRVAGDGRVDVPGPTYEWLCADNVPRWRLMPDGQESQGFRNHERHDAFDYHDYGTDWMAETIRGAGAYYRDNYLADNPDAPLLAVNDVSTPRGGDSTDHADHETGLACDLRLPRTDGNVGGVQVGDTDYDLGAMRAMLRAVRMQPKHERTLLSDRKLADEGLCTIPTDPDVREEHRNHAHVEITPLFPLTGYTEPFEDLLLDAIETFDGTLVNPVAYDVTVEGFQSYLDDLGVDHFTAAEVVTPHQKPVAEELGYETLMPARQWWTRAAAHVLLADELRSAAGEPAWMRNYWRPPEYNDRVEGANRSDHILGLAVDLDFETTEGKEIAQRRVETIRMEHNRLRVRYVTYEDSPLTIHASVLSPKGTGHVQL